MTLGNNGMQIIQILVAVWWAIREVANSNSSSIITLIIISTIINLDRILLGLWPGNNRLACLEVPVWWIITLEAWIIIWTRSGAGGRWVLQIWQACLEQEAKLIIWQECKGLEVVLAATRHSTGASEIQTKARNWIKLQGQTTHSSST